MLSVKDFPVLQTKKQVRVFWGLAGTTGYRHFIQIMHRLQHHQLTDLTKKAALNQVLPSAKFSRT